MTATLTPEAVTAAPGAHNGPWRAEIAAWRQWYRDAQANTGGAK